MNRRDFLRRSIGATAITTASVACGWNLSTLRRWLSRFLRAEPPQTATISFTQTNKRYGFDGYAGGVDFIYQNVVMSRAKLAAFEGLSE